MLFSKNWLQNHPQFLLHFLIHIDVLMLCRKFGADSDLNFLSYDHFLKLTNFWKKAWTIVHGFFRKMAQKSPHIFLTFSDTY